MCSKKKTFHKSLRDNKDWIEKRNSEVSVEEFKQLLKEHGKLLKDEDKENIQAINKEIDRLWEELHSENEKKYELLNGGKITMSEFIQSYDFKDADDERRIIFKDTRTWEGGWRQVPMTPTDPECSAFHPNDYKNYYKKLAEIKAKWQEKREIVLSRVSGT